MTRTHHPAAPLLSLAVALGIALGGLSACAQEEPEPKFAEQPPSADPTPEEKKETAKEFIRRWNRADAEMQNTGETGEYREMTKTCSPCTALADQVDEFYAAGGHVSTEGRTIKNIKRLDVASYLVWVNAGSTIYRESSEGPEGSYPGGDDLLRVTLSGKSGHFQLVDVTRQPR